MFESILCQVTDHDPDILDSLIGLAVENPSFSGTLSKPKSFITEPHPGL
jgi:hypothetical protein